MDINRERQVFCENVRRLRLERGYTVEQMAHVMRVSAEWVRRLERDDLPDEMDVSVAFYLAAEFGISEADLFRPPHE
ncbi:helix-turn-helix domain-containing protein [Feifania hominis]|uniref:Helix-turn-helix transcriptional regulator n=1 Tax=Feifania hominis TaxID=2763660 RepID=A0A926HVA1_9FIRM|nr:helix-turn-helix transcriptional regulator [Feifania hominis]MBC8537123.1 helix-turn-helix transcriptional regulator [Feifania hominis]